MDRDIPPDDDRTTKRDELLYMIQEQLQPIDSKSVRAPLSSTLYFQLIEMFAQAQQKCNQIVSS